MGTEYHWGGGGGGTWAGGWEIPDPLYDILMCMREYEQFPLRAPMHTAYYMYIPQALYITMQCYWFIIV